MKSSYFEVITCNGLHKLNRMFILVELWQASSVTSLIDQGGAIRISACKRRAFCRGNELSFHFPAPNPNAGDAIAFPECAVSIISVRCRQPRLYSRALTKWPRPKVNCGQIATTSLPSEGEASHRR